MIGLVVERRSCFAFTSSPTSEQMTLWGVCVRVCSSVNSAHTSPMHIGRAHLRAANAQGTNVCQLSLDKESHCPAVVTPSEAEWSSWPRMDLQRSFISFWMGTRANSPPYFRVIYARIPSSLPFILTALLHHKSPLGIAAPGVAQRNTTNLKTRTREGVVLPLQNPQASRQRSDPSAER